MSKFSFVSQALVTLALATSVGALVSTPAFAAGKSDKAAPAQQAQQQEQKKPNFVNASTITTSAQLNKDRKPPKNWKPGQPYPSGYVLPPVFNFKQQKFAKPTDPVDAKYFPPAFIQADWTNQDLFEQGLGYLTGQFAGRPHDRNPGVFAYIMTYLSNINYLPAHLYAYNAQMQGASGQPNPGLALQYLEKALWYVTALEPDAQPQVYIALANFYLQPHQWQDPAASIYYANIALTNGLFLPNQVLAEIHLILWSAYDGLPKGDKQEALKNLNQACSYGNKQACDFVKTYTERLKKSSKGKK